MYPIMLPARSGFTISRPAVPSVASSALVRLKNTDATVSYPDAFWAIIEEGGYKHQQVFKMDETDLQWKKMFDNTYILEEEKFA